MRRPIAAAGQRLRNEGWTVLQRALAALLAFMIARWIGHPDPFFAPIAAVVSLNTDVGDRGLNALKLLLGVMLGIVIGELTLLVVADQVLGLGLAVLIAIGVSTAVGGSRLVIAQAAASAVLTVSVSDGSAGPERFIDALIGAGVALVFTQALFSPDPLKLLRRAEAAALSEVGAGLRRAATAMGDDDRQGAHLALKDLRDARDRLADIATARDRSRRVARHSLTRRSGIRPLVSLTENASHLDLIGDDAVMAVRLALEGTAQQRIGCVEPMRRLAELVDRLAEVPGDPSNRQGVVDDMPGALRSIPPAEASNGAARILRMLAYDVMLYCGVEPASARGVLALDGASVSVVGPEVGGIPRLRRAARSARGLLSRGRHARGSAGRQTAQDQIGRKQARPQRKADPTRSEDRPG